MIDLRLSSERDTDVLWEIWTASFPGDEAWARWFLTHVYRPENALVAEENAHPEAMLHLLPTPMRLNGRQTTAGYVYAVATRPEARGRGLAGLLLEEAAKLAEARGYESLILVPQSDGLFEYYRKRGFRTGLTRKRMNLSEAEAQMPDGYETDAAPSPEALIKLYDAALAEIDHVVRTPDVLAHSLSYLRALGVRHRGQLAGYAIFAPGEQTVREFIATDETARSVLTAAVLRALDAPSFTAWGPGGDERYGMIRPLGTSTGDSARIYANLMLD